VVESVSAALFRVSWVWARLVGSLVSYRVILFRNFLMCCANGMLGPYSLRFHKET
jgi:hypothetical protein